MSGNIHQWQPQVNELYKNEILKAEKKSSLGKMLFTESGY